MLSRVLDAEVFGAVVAASPGRALGRRSLAKLVVWALAGMSDPDGEDGTVELPGGGRCWRAQVKDVADTVGGVTDRLVGSAMADLGLFRRRSHEGWFVFWSREQLDLLMAALGMDEFHISIVRGFGDCEAFLEGSDE